MSFTVAQLSRKSHSRFCQEPDCDCPTYGDCLLAAEESLRETYAERWPRVLGNRLQVRAYCQDWISRIHREAQS